MAFPISNADEDLIGLPPGAQEPQGLTVREARFVHYYVHGKKSLREAGHLAGFTHDHSGYDAKKRPHVQRAIQDALLDYRDSVSATLQQVISEYAKIAFFDPKALFDEHGNPLPLSEVDDLTAAAIAGLEVATDDVGGNIKTKVTKYKISDKRAALADLMKILGVTDKIELKGDLKHSLQVSFVRPRVIDDQ